MASAAGCSYKKRPGTSDDHGHAYERKMCCLMFLRGMRCGSFHLASNLDGAGAFDDVVFQLHRPDAPSRTYFIQLKHKKHEHVQPRAGLTAILTKKDFSLLTYFTSLRDEIMPRFKKMNNDQIYGSRLEDCSFVLYTNSKIENEPDASNVQDDILTTSSTGLTFSFVRDRDEDLFTFAQHMEAYREFLESLKGCDEPTVLGEKAATYMNSYRTEYLGEKLKGNINICEMAKQVVLKPSNEKRVEQIVKLSKYGDLTGYESFLERLIMCTRQSSEDRLDLTIQEEMCEILGLSVHHSAPVVKYLMAKVHDWWKSDNGAYLTEESPLWSETVAEALQVVNEASLREVKGLGVRFSEDETRRLAHKVNGGRVTMCLLKGDHTSLGVCKVLDALEREQRPYVLGHGEDALRFWRGPWCPLLVVECCKENAELLPSLASTLKLHSDKMLIAVVRDHDLQAVDTLKRLVQDGVIEVEDSLSLASLDESSREKVMAMEVKFQGALVPVKKLIRAEGELMQGLQGDLLLKLLKGDTICLGADLESGIKHYIPRTLRREDIVQLDAIRKLLQSDGRVVAVSGITKEELREVVNPDEYICPFDGLLTPGCRCYIVQNNSDMTLLGGQVKDFVGLDKRDGYLKIQSWNCGENIRHLVDLCTSSVRCPDTAWDFPDRVAIIVDDPGMGKSTIMAHVAQKTKQKRPDVWVVLVELRNMSSYLENVNTNDLTTEEAINFLATSSGITEQFERVLFKYFLETTENVVVLVDGFDEICMDYDKQVIEILKLLLRTNIVKLFVTSRPDWRRNLEQALLSVAFTMDAFTEDDQRNFLHKVWSARVPDVRAPQLQAFITDVLQVFSESTADAGRAFMGVPLQTMLVAEVYEEHLRQWKTTSLKAVHMDVVVLYQAFFDKKCEVYFVQKRGDNIAKPIVRREMMRKKRYLEENHILAALISYLTPTNLKNLHDKSVYERASKYLREESYEWSMIGIVHSFNNGKPKFLHRTIIEFFVAKWLAKYYDLNRSFLQEHLLTADFSVVRSMFNIIMTQGFPMHTAALNNNLQALRQGVSEDNVNVVDRGGRTLLHIAAANGNVREILQLLISHGADVDAVDTVLQWSPVQYADHGANWEALDMLLQGRNLAPQLVFTELHKEQAVLAACRHGHVDLLQYLLRTGLDANAVLIHHGSKRAIHVACEHGQVRVLHCLLVAGADVNAADLFKTTALHVAARSGDLAIVKRLLKAEANVRSEFFDRSTALHMSAQCGHLDVVKCLLRFGADVNAQDETGCTPLDVAAASKHFEISSCMDKKVANEASKETSLLAAVKQTDLCAVKRLLDAKGTPAYKEEDFQNILIFAIGLENVDMMQMLLEHGIAAEGVDDNLDLLLHYAVKKGKLNMARLLVDHGAAVDATSGVNFPPVITAAVRGHVDLVRLFIGRGCAVDGSDENRMTGLHAAAFVGHLHVVLLLLDEGAAVDAVNKEGGIPLHFAASAGHLEIVRLLVQKRSNVNHTDNKNMTPLHLAATRGHASVVQFLIDNGSEFNKANSSGMSPLQTAVNEDNIDVVRILIENGAHLNTPAMGNLTPLGTAAIGGHAGIARLLIDNGARLKATDANVSTPLHYAAASGCEELVRLFLEEGSDVNALSEMKLTPLHVAAKKGSLNIVRLLVESGSSCHALSLSGSTPVMYASEEKHLDVVQYLLQQGSALDRLHASTVALLHHAVAEGDEHATRMLLDQGVAADARDENRRTALHVASTKGYNDIALLLFGKNCTLDSVDEDLRTSLHCAASEGHRDTVWLLTEMGCKVACYDKDKCTPLHLAIQKKNFGVASILIHKGSPLDDRNNDGRTPLHSAVLTGHLEITRLLVDSRSALDALDNENKTPLHYASISGQVDITRLLIDNGCALDILSDITATPLHHAVLRGNMGVIELLLEGGCAVDAPGKLDLTSLHFAALEGFLDTVRLLLENGATVNARDKHGMTALHFAAGHGHFDIVYQLLETGSAVDALDSDGRSALHCASLQGHLDIALLLVENGFSVDGISTVEGTPLHCAVLHGHLEVVRYLLTAGASANARDEQGKTPLHVAAAVGYLDIARLLINEGGKQNALDMDNLALQDCGAKEGQMESAPPVITNGSELDALDVNKMTPLHYAALRGHMRVADLLILSGCVVDAVDVDCRTPLHHAAMRGDLRSVRLLMEMGSNKDHLDKHGRSPMTNATAGGHVEVVEFLLDRGCTVGAVDQYGVTALIVAAFNGHENVVRFLVETGSSVDACDVYGRTALHYAATGGYLNVVRLCVESGSEVDALDENCMSPLYLAARQGSVDVVRFLIQKGGAVNMLNANHNTALQSAAEAGHLEVVRLLIASGGTVNSPDRQLDTALHGATLEGHVDVARLLVVHGADVDVVNEDGRTPLHNAALRGHLGVVKLLIDKGSKLDAVDFCNKTALDLAGDNAHDAVVVALQAQTIWSENSAEFEKLTDEISNSMAGAVSSILDLVFNKGTST